MKRLLYLPVLGVSFFVGFGSAAAQADPLSLGTGLSLAWNTDTNPVNSPPLHLPVINDADPDTNALQLSAFTIWLQVRPLAATGTLEIDLPTFFYATDNPVITDPDLGNPAGVDNLPLYVAFSGSDAVVTHFNDVADGQNLAKLQFRTPDNARGLFALVAVNDDTTDGTGWLDNNNQPQAFSNSPFVAGGELVLGTINVVPEPGSILIGALGLVSLLAYGLRLRRTRA